MAPPPEAASHKLRESRSAPSIERFIPESLKGSGILEQLTGPVLSKDEENNASYIRSLESRVKQLERERAQWVSMYRGEARGRAVILGLQHTNDRLEHENMDSRAAQEDAVAKCELALEQEKKARLEAERWRQLCVDASQPSMRRRPGSRARA